MICTDCYGLIFQFLEGLGALATFGAFLMLFRRDKDKQEQINKLTGIAMILDAQNDTMKAQNDLISQQVEILRNSTVSGGDNEALNQLKEIEEKKLKLSVRPDLWTNGAGYNGTTGELRVDLSNKGQKAKLLEFKLISGDIALHSKSLPYDLEKGKSIYIYGRQQGNVPISRCEYEIDVVYTDALENKYLCKLKGIGASVKITETKEIS